jgi:hypothetical protein
MALAGDGDFLLVPMMCGHTSRRWPPQVQSNLLLGEDGDAEEGVGGRGMSIVCQIRPDVDGNILL